MLRSVNTVARNATICIKATAITVGLVAFVIGILSLCALKGHSLPNALSSLKEVGWIGCCSLIVGGFIVVCLGTAIRKSKEIENPA